MCDYVDTYDSNISLYPLFIESKIPLLTYLRPYVHMILKLRIIVSAVMSMRIIWVHITILYAQVVTKMLFRFSNYRYGTVLSLTNKTIISRVGIEPTTDGLLCSSY